MFLHLFSAESRFWIVVLGSVQATNNCCTGQFPSDKTKGVAKSKPCLVDATKAHTWLEYFLSTLNVGDKEAHLDFSWDFSLRVRDYGPVKDTG